MPLKDPVARKAYDAAYNVAHREEKKAYNAAYFAAHKEKIRAHIDVWKANHPLRQMLYVARHAVKKTKLRLETME